MMNKIILVILLMISLSCAKAQVTNPVTSKPLVDFPTVYTFAAGDYLAFWDVSADNLFKIRLDSLKNYIERNMGVGTILSSDNTFTGENVFTKAIGLASLTNTSTTNGLFMNSSTGKPAYNYNGTIYNLVNTNDLIGSGVVDSSHIVYDNVSDTLSSTYKFTGDLDLTVGNFYMPYETAAQSDSANGNYRLYFNRADSLFWFNAHDNNNDKFPIKLVTTDYLDNHFNFTGAYLLSSGTQTGISSSLTWSSGGATFGANTKLVPPLLTQSGSHTWVEGALYQRQGNQTGYLYQDYYDNSYNEKTAVFEDTTKTQARIDNTLKNRIVTETDTLDWDKGNYLHKFTISANTVITFKNVSPKVVNVAIANGGSYTVSFNFAGGSIRTPGGVSYTATDTGSDFISFVYISSTEVWMLPTKDMR